jgi:hypothetical protein
MLGQIVAKQRLAVDVVKTALLGAGIRNRSVCVTADSWSDAQGRRENYSVFVGSPLGVNEEPFYVTGGTIVEAVRKMVDSIKGRGNDAKPGNPEVAPF